MIDKIVASIIFTWFLVGFGAVLELATQTDLGIQWWFVGITVSILDTIFWLTLGRFLK